MPVGAFGVLGSAFGGILQNRENRRSQRLNERQNALALRYQLDGLQASQQRYGEAAGQYGQAIGVLEGSYQEARNANALAGYNAYRNVGRQVTGSLNSITSRQGVRGINSGSASLNARARLLREAGNVYGNIGAQIGSQDSQIALTGGRQVAQGHQLAGQAAQQQGRTEAQINSNIAGVPLQLEYQPDQSIASSVGALGGNLDLLLKGWRKDAGGS